MDSSFVGAECQHISNRIGERFDLACNSVDSTELSEILCDSSALPKIDNESLSALCSRLHTELSMLFPSILEATQQETAFNQRDCLEVAQSCLDYVEGFSNYFANLQSGQIMPTVYNDELGQRSINQIALPWGTIAAILPQSAFLFLSLTCLLNGLATGNRVILRTPTQSARSAALLSLALERAQIPDNYVRIVNASGKTFMRVLCESSEPMLIHYLGSSRHAPEIMSSCFQAGKQVLIDGEGNVFVWVDKDTPLDYAVEILSLGALRYNGQTCTSINGAIIHPHIYDRLKKLLTERWNEITFGDPLEADVLVGPLSDEAQAEQCLTKIKESGATILAGNYRQGKLLAPTLMAEPREDSELVSDGFFGSALWILSGDFESFASLWRKNHYPLCAGILTQSGDIDQYLSKIPNAARLVINGDPSSEHIYEPWGGYPGSGNNTVSHWYCKYLRNMQIDQRT